MSAHDAAASLSEVYDGVSERRYLNAGKGRVIISGSTADTKEEKNDRA